MQLLNMVKEIKANFNYLLHKEPNFMTSINTILEDTIIL
jgi:hypothetical protein